MIKLDENLGVSVVQLFARAGHEVLTVQQEGLAGADDRTVIEAARNEDRCLVTLDMDFSNPLVFDPRRYAGIAVLRLPPRSSLHDLEEATRTLIEGLRQRDITGRLWSIQRGVVREYQSDDDPIEGFDDLPGED